MNHIKLRTTFEGSRSIGSCDGYAVFPHPQKGRQALKTWLNRTVGKESQNQCIWAFINGISNTKDEALESAEIISKVTNGEVVLSMPNDTVLSGLKDGEKHKALINR